MHRVFLSVGALAASALLSSTAIASTAAASPQGVSSTSVSLKGSLAGGVKAASSGDPVVFVFTAKNTSSTSQPVQLELMNVTGASETNQLCVDAHGSTFNPDGNFCEPSSFNAGQTSSALIYATVGTAVSFSAKLCVHNATTGVNAPCTTVSAKG